jgi:Mg-chelatase subunit ChlD
MVSGGYGHSAPADRIAIVGFSDKAYTILLPTLMSEAGVRSRIDQLTGKYFRNPGLTNLAAGMEQGLAFLEKAPRGVVRKMVIIGDGEPNVGNERLAALADRARKSYVSICTIYAGQGNAPVFQSVCDKSVGGWKTSVTKLGDLAAALRRAGGSLGAGRSRRRAIIVVVIDMSASMSSGLAGEPGVTRIEACRKALHAMLDWHGATYGVKVAA